VPHLHILPLISPVSGTFNIRGSDVPYNPVLMSFGLVMHTSAHLYTDEAKIGEDVRKHLGDVKVLPYSQIFEDLRALDRENKVLIVNPLYALTKCFDPNASIV